MSEQFKFHKSAIEWRRGVVLQKLSEGYSQSEIAQELKLHPSTISLDCQWLRETSAQNLHVHIEERIPEQYQRCRAGYEIVLRRSWEIANNPNSKTSEVLDSLKLFSDTHTKLKELSTDEKTIDQAISWIEKKKEILKQQEQEQQEQEQSQSIVEEEELEQEEDG